jgi:hypothetical protein
MESLPGSSAVVLVAAVPGVLGVVVGLGPRRASRAAVSARSTTFDFGRVQIWTIDYQLCVYGAAGAVMVCDLASAA